MSTYQARPITISAVFYDGTNVDEVKDLLHGSAEVNEYEQSIEVSNEHSIIEILPNEWVLLYSNSVEWLSDSDFRERFYV